VVQNNCLLILHDLLYFVPTRVRAGVSCSILSLGPKSAEEREKAFHDHFKYPLFDDKGNSFDDDQKLHDLAEMHRIVILVRFLIWDDTKKGYKYLVRQ